MNHFARVQNILTQLETELIHFYGLEQNLRAAEHLIAFDEYAQLTHGRERGSVLMQQTDDQIFVGIGVAQPIANILSAANPLATLNNRNLDAFWVLAEELSHFLLITQRTLAGQSVTPTELEWQGEIDKLLLAALYLYRQVGNSHYLPLARKLFDESEVFKADHVHYHDANAIAARFWFGHANYLANRPNPHQSPALQELLRELYHLPWTQKLSRIATRQDRKAA